MPSRCQRCNVAQCSVYPRAETFLLGLRWTLITGQRPNAQQGSSWQCQEEGWPLPGLYLQESGSSSRAWWGRGGSWIRRGCVSRSWCTQRHHPGEWHPSSAPSLHTAPHSLLSWQASPKPKARVNGKGWALCLWAAQSLSHLPRLEMSHLMTRLGDQSESAC